MLYADDYFLSIFELDNIQVTEVLRNSGRKEQGRGIFRNKEEQNRKAKAGKYSGQGIHPPWTRARGGSEVGWNHLPQPCGLDDASLQGLPAALLVSAKGRNSSLPLPIC